MLKRELEIRPRNKRLSIYNMFPRDYISVQEMIEHLSLIHKMGFSAVWINPIQSVSQTPHHGDARAGSLYAMVDAESFVDFLPDCSLETLSVFNHAAKEFGLITMFDLVLAHVSCDAAIVREKPKYFKQGKHDYPDVVQFNFDDPSLTDEILKDYWFPFIAKYMRLGFTGIRVDQAKPSKISPMLQKKIYDFVVENFDPQCIIFAEVLFGAREGSLTDICNDLRSIQRISHITNSVYYSACSFEARKNNSWNNDNILEEIGLKTSVCSGNGGSIGFTGSHDELPLACKVILSKSFTSANINPKKFDQIIKKELQRSGMLPSDIKVCLNSNLINAKKIGVCKDFISSNNYLGQPWHLLKMKEKIAMVSLTSDGGWYLMSGDEYGCTEQRSVFNNHQRTGSFREKWFGEFNLTDFIQQINRLVAIFPPVDLGEWVQHVVLDSQPCAFIVIKHFKGYSSHLIIVNIGENELELSEEENQRIYAELPTDKKIEQVHLIYTTMKNQNFLLL